MVMLSWLLAVTSSAGGTAADGVVDSETVEALVRSLLVALGESHNAEVLANTPGRVARMYAELLAGRDVDPVDHFAVGFDGERGGVVAVSGIEFASLCEHHLLPFEGTVDIAYSPSLEGRIAGLSKLARAVDTVARRLQLQERMTEQIAQAVEVGLRPSWLAVRVRATHSCMSVRGVRKSGAVTETYSTRGVLPPSLASRSVDSLFRP